MQNNERRFFLKRLIRVSGYLTLGGMVLNACGQSDFSVDQNYFTIDPNRCTGCKDCFSSCHHHAISLSGSVAEIDINRCTACGKCVFYCSHQAIARG